MHRGHFDTQVIHRQHTKKLIQQTLATRTCSSTVISQSQIDGRQRYLR